MLWNSLETLTPLCTGLSLSRHCYYAPIIDHRRYQIPQMFPSGKPGDFNKVICFLGGSERVRTFATLASDMIANLALFIDGTQCLPLYRYTEDGSG